MSKEIKDEIPNVRAVGMLKDSQIENNKYILSVTKNKITTKIYLGLPTFVIYAASIQELMAKINIDELESLDIFYNSPSKLKTTDNELIYSKLDIERAIWVSIAPIACTNGQILYKDKLEESLHNKIINNFNK